MRLLLCFFFYIIDGAVNHRRLVTDVSEIERNTKNVIYII